MQVPGNPLLLLRDRLCNQSSGGEKIVLCIAFFILIITIAFIVIISFVLLNCLYLNPQVLLFVHSLSHPTAGWSERAAAWS